MDISERRRRVSAEAAEWWVHMQGEVSHTQREQYVDWLRESSLHVAEMLRVAQIHGAVEQFAHWTRLSSDGSGNDDNAVVTLQTPTRRRLLESPRQRPKQFRRAWWAAAAAVTVITVLTIVMFFTLRDQVIQTDRAERREVALADGSVVHVDPDTRLRIKFETGARHVFLEHGRALFHVAKDANRPFLVEANSTTVRAVGTAFAVERESDSILVTVSEGKIAVFPAQSATEHVSASEPPATGFPPRRQASRGGSSNMELLSSQGTEAAPRLGQSAPLDDSGGPTREIFLTANQQVTVARSGDAEPVHTVDSSRVLAWADGRLIFDNTTVSDAIGQFNRYNRIQIHVHDTELAHRPVSGVFDAADPDSFVEFIQSLIAVRVFRSPNADITIDPAK